MAKFCCECKRVSKFDIQKQPCGECYFAKDKNGRRTKPKFQAKRTRGKNA